jgi:hypothetical protein
MMKGRVPQKDDIPTLRTRCFSCQNQNNVYNVSGGDFISLFELILALRENEKTRPI